jgi:5-hydroxyisourate hydrolase-like protein (transthyretin family)
MRWLLVLAMLVVAVVAVLTWRSGGERDRAMHVGEALADAEEQAPRAGELETAPVDMAPVDVAREAGRSELADETPRVRGVVRVDDGQPLGEEATLQVDVHATSGARPRKLDAPVAGDGRFDFTVPAGTSYVTLELRAQGLHTPTDIRAQPGEEVVVVALRRAREPAADRGWVVSGIVRDQDGRPFADATIFTTDPGSNGWTSGGENQTDQDGRFELTGLERRAWRIGAYSMDAVGTAFVDIEPTIGDVLGLELTLQRGGCIGGTVHWSDGEAAGDFELETDGVTGWSRTQSFREGEFQMCGLIEDEFVVRARATRYGEVGIAELAGLRPGATALRLVLVPQAAFDVGVSVRDEHGEPIDGLRIWASSDKGGSVHASGDGNVRLTPLVPGEWRISLSASGFVTLDESLELGPSSPDLSFVLSASARIHGTVLDAAGNPAADAEVRAGEGWTSESARTDETGRFELELQAGKTRVRARKSGHGPSEELLVMTEAGRTAEELVLRLRDACALQGRVLDESGDPVPGAWVMVGGPDGDDAAECDQNGAFELRDLAPGPTRVNAFVMDGGSRTSARVILVAGATSTLELRFRPADPVRVFGRITRAGRPHEGFLGFLSDDGLSEVGCGPDGRFEATLSRPGTWNAIVRLEDAEPHEVRMLEFTVPDADEHELTLEIDAMRRIESFDEVPF